MDVSLNLIDLQYLTNPDKLTKLMQKKDLQQIPHNDLDFYKKRIFQLTKDMLRGEKINTKVTKAFVNYAQICIDHFKFTDMMELIQNIWCQSFLELCLLDSFSCHLILFRSSFSLAARGCFVLFWLIGKGDL